MCSVAVIVLLAFVTEVHAETSMQSLQSTEAADVQEKLAGRVLKSAELRGAGFDLTTIGKRRASGRQAEEEVQLKHKADLEMAAKQSAPMQQKEEPKSTAKQSVAAQPKVEQTPTAKQSTPAQPKVEPEPPAKESATAQPKAEPEPSANQPAAAQPKVEPEPKAKQSAAAQPKLEPTPTAKQSAAMQPKIGVELVANVSAGVQPKAKQEQPKSAVVHSNNVQPKAAGAKHNAKQEPTALHTADVQQDAGLELAELKSEEHKLKQQLASPSVDTEDQLTSNSDATYSSAQHKVAFELAAQKSKGMQQVYDSFWTSCGGMIAAVMIVLLAGSGAIVAMRRFQRRRALTENDYVMMMAA
eukprot:gnl/TRDRNA2_/TRDRNA2_44143_c0_seq2.p1 gnl/TRDRNA2_/TRDRNA2_44143_c0~~gnl/TRDRNA2_/TRDRNA2_44143_c0_seq2.p1  ORF type:complete len:356 (-),score=96.42 gnl/TRDRNA2_/TRDRNA2_44143_c0_seq2:436-1503(-)